MDKTFDGAIQHVGTFVFKEYIFMLLNNLNSPSLLKSD